MIRHDSAARRRPERAGDKAATAAATARVRGRVPAAVLRQTGRVRFLRRPAGGNEGLKRILSQAPPRSRHAPASRAFCARKRREGERHHQAQTLIALARRRLDVLWAAPEARQAFQPRGARAA